MSLPRYPEYKDSGADWLGSVPAQWSVSRLKSKVALVTEKATQRTRPVALENIEGWSGKFISTEGEFEGEGVAFFAGDLLFGKLRPYLAKVFLADGSGEAVGDFHVLRPNHAINSRFLQYQILNKSFIDIIDGSTFGSKMPRASWVSLGNMPLTLPSPDEQTAIAAFLDRETAKIDALIAEQEKLIALLAEKRQATISHAVTRGLNPNAPMKDSGVAWLGEVPAHWDVGAVKRFFIGLDGRRIPLSAEERGGRQGEYPYYGASGVIDNIDEFIFDEDLVLVSEDGANLLNRSTPIAFVATGKYWVNNHAHILKPEDDNLRFWAERIEALDLTPVVTGSAQPKLTVEALMNLVISAPPSGKERADISAFIESETQKLDALTLESERGITLLKERRSALIAATVTGQIDVRGNLPEVA